MGDKINTRVLCLWFFFNRPLEITEYTKLTHIDERVKTKINIPSWPLLCLYWVRSVSFLGSPPVCSSGWPICFFPGRMRVDNYPCSSWEKKPRIFLVVTSVHLGPAPSDLIHKRGTRGFFLEKKQRILLVVTSVHLGPAPSAPRGKKTK